MDSNNITEFIINLEREFDLYSFTIDDVQIWKYLRRPIKNSIINENNLRGKPHDQRLTGPITSISKILQNCLHKNPFFESDQDILFFGHPRRKLLEDGHWWDIYCDPVINELDLDYCYFETPYLDQHRKPSKTSNIRYLDLIHYTGDVRQMVGKQFITLASKEREFISEINGLINSEFEIDLNLIDMSIKYLANRAISIPLYQKILQNSNPDVLVLVVSYGKENLIEACKQSNIPVVEFQHGVFHNNHLGYHFPNESSIKSFPDYLFTWGEFWSDSIEFPIPDERVMSVGYPYLEQRRSKYADIDQKNQILFISQGTIGAKFSKLAVEIDQHPTIDHDVVYKLHPGEYNRWQDEYPWLVDADLDVIDGSEPPLYKLFAESSTQIGVGSTAVYEGLCFDLETYVYDLPGASVLEPLVDDGVAELISSVDELVSSLGTRRTTFDREYYFEPNATENVCQTLQQLASDGIYLNLE